MKRPCRHDGLFAGCVYCTLYATSPFHAALWGGPAPPAGGTPRPAPEVPLPCVHRGGPTGESVSCPSCSGRVTLKVFACDVYGVCTVARAAGGLACCRTCDRREAPSVAPAPPPPR